MRSVRLLCVMLLPMMCGVAACSPDADKSAKSDPPKAAAVDSSVSTEDSLGRPLDKGTRVAKFSRNIAAEGGRVENFDLVKGPAYFPLNFTTYLTSNVQQAYSQIAGTAMATFSPMLDNVRDPNTYIQVQYDTTALAPADAAGAWFQKIATSRKLSDVAVTPNTSFPWALDGKSFSFTEAGKKYAGVILVGKHGTYSYRIIAQYPPASSKAIAPYFNTVLGQWRWEDDKTYLVPSGAAPPPIKLDSLGNPIPRVPRAGTSSTK